ncbi:MAG TPA: hypothetical protein VHC48_19550 [Puia sp.]|nr:hypothetical protein [Puia sp.]
MRQSYLIIIALTGLMASSCLKTSSIHPAQNAKFVSAAKGYFTDSVLAAPGSAGDYKSGIARTVVWEKALYLKFPKAEVVLVPVRYRAPLMVKASFAGEGLFHLDDLTKLLIYRRPGEPFHMELLTAVPDSGYVRDPAGSFSGYVFTQDWWGHEVDQYLYSIKGEVRKYESPSVQASSLVRSCNMIYGYNYAAGDPGGGYSWVQTGGCTYMYLPDRVDDVHGGLSGGLGMTGGGGVGGGATTNLLIPPPDNPIANLADYIKCFTNVGGSDHVYTVTICVEQPVPGSRTAYKLTDGGPIGSSMAGNIVDVGHTFLVFTEHYGNTTIARNIGFYPSKGVTPRSPSAPGKLNNDENHSYNISATFTVTNASFFNMLNYAGRGSDETLNYNLSSENCTTFSLQTLVQGGINLPVTNGFWPGGMGANPGDLGEDIRQMSPLPNMNKGTVQNFHPNIGNCQ